MWIFPWAWSCLGSFLNLTIVDAPAPGLYICSAMAQPPIRSGRNGHIIYSCFLVFPGTYGTLFINVHHAFASEHNSSYMRNWYSRCPPVILVKDPQGSGHDRNSYDDYETIYLAWLIWTWFVYMVTMKCVNPPHAIPKSEVCNGLHVHIICQLWNLVWWFTYLLKVVMSHSYLEQPEGPF